MKRFLFGSAAVLIVLLSLRALLRAEDWKVDFDQGPDASAALMAAKQAVAEDTTSHGEQAVSLKRVCDIHFKTPALKLKGEDHYAHARYIVSEKCEPKLAFATFAKAAPKETLVANPGMVVSPMVSAELNRVSRKPTATSSYACTVIAWEQEVVQARMIEIQNSTTWEADGTDILNANINAQSTTYFSWWHLIAGPFARAWWVIEYRQAHTLGQASFNCNGAPFCPNGPAYPMTLKAETDVYANGGCSGYASYDGQLTPGGAFDYSVSR